MTSNPSVLHLNVNDRNGGAAHAARRLHQGLLELGLPSAMLVDVKTSQDPTVLSRSYRLFGRRGAQIYAYLDKLPIFLLYQKRRMAWSINWMPRTTARTVNQLNPDIINLHWIGDGFVSLYELAHFHAPLVWTLHDLWAFTGGCHYDEGCGRYTQFCGDCPQLASGRQQDLSRWVWKQKARHWRHTDLTLVAPSRWMADCIRRSSLFGNHRVENIPNGLDPNLYRPQEKAKTRAMFGLPQDQRLILFGAASVQGDRRKGLTHLLSALELGAPQMEHCILATFGNMAEGSLQHFPVPVQHMGAIHDESILAALYAAADIFVAPSLQDNLPNTVIEALACGTPCVAFDIGGMPDMIEHKRNGYLAQPFQPEDLAHGIAWTLEDPARWRELSAHARRKVEEEFTLALQAQRYLKLYEELLEHRKEGKSWSQRR